MATDLKALVGPHEVETPSGVVTTFYTTDGYVDCKCADDYIRQVEIPAGLEDDALDNHVVCQNCGARYGDVPSSRANEVLEAGLDLDPESLERHGPVPPVVLTDVAAVEREIPRLPADKDVYIEVVAPSNDEESSHGVTLTREQAIRLAIQVVSSTFPEEVVLEPDADGHLYMKIREVTIVKNRYQDYLGPQFSLLDGLARHRVQSTAPLLGGMSCPPIEYTWAVSDDGGASYRNPTEEDKAALRRAVAKFCYDCGDIRKEHADAAIMACGHVAHPGCHIRDGRIDCPMRRRVDPEHVNDYEPVLPAGGGGAA